MHGVKYYYMFKFLRLFMPLLKVWSSVSSQKLLGEDFRSSDSVGGSRYNYRVFSNQFSSAVARLELLKSNKNFNFKLLPSSHEEEGRGLSSVFLNKVFTKYLSVYKAGRSQMFDIVVFTFVGRSYSSAVENMLVFNSYFANKIGNVKKGYTTSVLFPAIVEKFTQFDYTLPGFRLEIAQPDASSKLFNFYVRNPLFVRPPADSSKNYIAASAFEKLFFDPISKLRKKVIDRDEYLYKKSFFGKFYRKKKSDVITHLMYYGRFKDVIDPVLKSTFTRLPKKTFFGDVDNYKIAFGKSRLKRLQMVYTLKRDFYVFFGTYFQIKYFTLSDVFFSHPKMRELASNATSYVRQYVSSSPELAT
jgi:hypothetical protein